MEYSNLIHDFVDGTLSSAEEGKLFSELAANGGLRSELKQFIEFERTARFDTDAYVPSAQTTANIFARVGIDNPAFNPVNTSNPGSGLVGLISKYTQGIIGGVVTAILTASVMYFGMNNSTVSGESGAMGNNTKQEQNISETQKNSNFPIANSEEKEESKIIERVIIKYVPVNAIDEKPVQDQNITPNNSNISEESIPIEKSIINQIFKNQNISLKDNNYNVSLNPVELKDYQLQQGFSFFNLLEKTGLSIELTGSDYWTFPNAEVPKPSSAIFENKSITILYPIAESFNLGTELRQESFNHKWIVPIGSSDSSWQYRSNNNYYSAGVLLRWIPYEFKYFIPFIQTGFGFNQAGPTGRLMFGTEFNTSSNYGFIIGLEGSLLYYHSNNEWLPAKKIGLHYGLKFKL